MGEAVSLAEKPSHHLTKVLRLETGDPVIVFNGDGYEYPGIIVEIHAKSVAVKIQAQDQPGRESELSIELGQGVSRGERMDFVLQKSVELGVTRVTPLWTDRCQVKLDGSRLAKRLAHWTSIIHSACEQSGRTAVPQLQHPTTLASWTRLTDKQLGLVLDPTATRNLREITPARDIKLLIGPEGGLSDEEISTATGFGFIPVRLGPRILRTETAALASVTALQTLWGDMSL